MRLILAILFLCIGFTKYSLANTTCRTFLRDQNYFSAQILEKIDRLDQEDRMVLETLVYFYLGHTTLEEFAQRGFLDFEFYSTPNYSPLHHPLSRAHHLHYKLYMHYQNATNSMVYNSVTQIVVEKYIRDHF